MYMDNSDPWDWTKKIQQAAPLGAQIKPSEASTPGYVDTTGPMTKMAEGIAITKGANAIDKGYAAYKAAGATEAAAPLSANAVIGQAAPAMSLAPAAPTALAEGLAAEGITGVAAPLMSTTASGAALAGSEAVAGGALASGGASAAAGGAALAGAEAALAAGGPVTWAIGAGLLAKKLGIF